MSDGIGTHRSAGHADAMPCRALPTMPLRTGRDMIGVRCDAMNAMRCHDMRVRCDAMRLKLGMRDYLEAESEADRKRSDTGLKCHTMRGGSVIRNPPYAIPLKRSLV